LSFAQRIEKTLPESYRSLIGPEKEKDVPDFKFSDASKCLCNPYVRINH
jgi:nuclear cap-binding protein subunit 1